MFCVCVFVVVVQDESADTKLTMVIPPACGYSVAHSMTYIPNQQTEANIGRLLIFVSFAFV